jgi:hypothetical protein
VIHKILQDYSDPFREQKGGNPRKSKSDAINEERKMRRYTACQRRRMSIHQAARCIVGEALGHTVTECKIWRSQNPNAHTLYGDTVPYGGRTIYDGPDTGETIWAGDIAEWLMELGYAEFEEIWIDIPPHARRIGLLSGGDEPSEYAIKAFFECEKILTDNWVKVLTKGRELIADCHNPPAQTADDIVSYLFGPGINSHERCRAMLNVLPRDNPDIVWSVFLGAWSSCDVTWTEKESVLRMLADTGGDALDHYNNESRAFFDALPDTVTVHRGCSLERVDGLAWTTDKAVAEGFARGHRGIKVPNAVVATGTIRKDKILAVFVDRKESEILAKHADVEGLTVAAYKQVI